MPYATPRVRGRREGIRRLRIPLPPLPSYTINMEKSSGMRRKDREILDPGIFREILMANNSAYVSLVDNGAPYGIMMNYAPRFLGGEIQLLFHGAQEGRKIDCLRQCPQACVFINDRQAEAVSLQGERPSGRTTTHYRSLILQGTMHFLPDGEEKRLAAQCFLQHFAQGGGEVEMPPEAMLAKTAFLLFRPASITGKANPPIPPREAARP